VQKITPADDMPEGGDIADLAERWIDIPKEQQREMIETLMVDAEACGASAALDLWHRAVYDGSWRNLDWPLESCGRLSRATMPGCLTVLCASPGAGKSWMILQLMAHWNLSGTRTVVRMLEDDAQAHMARLLAHLSRNGLHTDDKWVRHNREQVEAEKAACRADLDHLGALIVPEQRELWEHSDMVAWVERHAKAGARVIVIDPITAVKAGREPWLQDFESVMRIKDIAYRYECSIIVTTHPRTTSREPAMTNLAGGSAWSRFAHTVLWIEHHEEGDELTATDGEPICCNRVLHILKTRHGKGAGCKIALQWLDSCSFAEVGLVGSGKPSAAAPKKPQSPRRPVAPVTTESRAALGEQAADMLFGDA
jgi:hypothetical protein